MRRGQRRTAVLVILGLGLCAIGTREIKFWTLPSYEFDRTAVKLEWFAGAYLFPDDEGMCGVSFAPTVTDSRLGKAVEIVSVLDGIRYVSISSGSVSSQGYKPLTRLRKLSELRVRYCPVDAEGMEHIATIRGLRRLILDEALVDAEAIHPLQNARELEVVVIDGHYDESRIDLDDESLKHLCEIITLKEIHLIRAGITAGEAEFIRGERPDVKLDIAN